MEREIDKWIDCTEIKKQVPHAPSGTYNIQPAGRSFPFKVYCEMRSDGGWTVFQRRSGGSVSFNREWIDYKSGFGSLSNDHWLGLEQVFLMTNSRDKSWTLRVDLWDFEGGTAYAEYKNFKLGNEQTAYKLQVGPYVGTAGDAIRGAYPGTEENGYGFTTIDRDNDGCNPCLVEGDIAIFSCVQIKSGAWWFSKCGSAALNGEWQPDGDNIGSSSGLHWLTWKFPQHYSAKATRMMIKSE
ncbi:fibrinogen-like protein 1 [Nematolebias whitei]|uniref:fibrinogen-like protein 1 n=1 Tax=Nematolebias whitei TaxID=451745 RepID=UPI001897AF58|nr:fibrinogen-like protein 1 [Nematolebias whitei]